MSTEVRPLIPRDFVWKRLHSLLGLGVVVYLIEHLLVNSQAALWLGHHGAGFIRLVNLIQAIPYLQIVETLLIGIPILVHAVLGIKYALTSKGNFLDSKGKKPSMRYGRNFAFSWQRITSWILLFGILGHVIQMRYLDKPEKVTLNNEKKFLVKLSFDAGLYTLANRLDVNLYNSQSLRDLESSLYTGPVYLDKWTSSDSIPYKYEEGIARNDEEALRQQKKFREKLNHVQLKSDQVLGIASDFGTGVLLMVRETFKSPLMAILYTIFVVAAVFHAFNGTWTFLITWGAILSYRSQKVMVNVIIAIMLAVGFLGLASIWGSYWINLRS